jgi:hypothetical protein
MSQENDALMEYQIVLQLIRIIRSPRCFINYINKALLVLKNLNFLLYNHDEAYANIIFKIIVLIY